MPDIQTPEAPVQANVPDPAKQVQRKKGKKKVLKRIIALVVALAILGGIGFGLWYFVFRTEEVEQTIYSEPAFIGSIQSTVQGSGNATAKETATLTVPANGTVQELLVAAGDTVYAGQELYTVSSPAAQEAVANAEAALKRARDQVTDSQEQVAEAQKRVVEAQERVTAAQKYVEDLREDREELIAAKADLTLTAPFAGKLLEVAAFNTGDPVGAGSTLATLVNDKQLKFSLYISYAYENDIQVGQDAEVSVPAMMYTCRGRVDSIHKVNYITPEGGMYFEAVIVFDNPGTLTAGMTASASLRTAAGDPVYPYSDGVTEYYETRTITAKLDGPLVQTNMRNYADVEPGQTLMVQGPDDQDALIAAKEEEITAAEKSVQDAQDGVTAAQDGVVAAQEAVTAAEEGVATAQETLDKAIEDAASLSATAPIDGQIISCTISTGSEVHQGDAVITITNTNTMVVNISVDDRNIGFISLGMLVELSDYSGNVYNGVVTDIAAQGEVGTGMSTFPVTLEVENWAGTLYAGAWLNYSFVTSQSNDCVMVPTTAVKYFSDMDGNRQAVVFVQRDQRPDDVPELNLPTVDQNSTRTFPSEEDGFYPVIVETGISDVKNVEIVSGVEVGETVFVNYTVTSSASGW